LLVRNGPAPRPWPPSHEAISLPNRRLVTELEAAVTGIAAGWEALGCDP